MSKIKFGQETYTWIMIGDKYIGQMDHMAKLTHQAGFDGMEPLNLQMGDYYDTEKMKATLAENQLELTSFGLICDWLSPSETDAEKEESEKALNFLKAFPGCMCMMVQMPQQDRSNLEERQKNLILNMNEISRKFVDNGIMCTYHPNSPDGSIWKTEEDYHKLLPQLDSNVIKWTPDVGHIAKDGMDPVKLMRDYRELINHVHYKDMNADGTWALTGKGVIDFETITKDLVETGFEGWIICEDEVEEAIQDPDGITLEDGKYIQNTMRSWVKTGAAV